MGAAFISPDISPTVSSGGFHSTYTIAGGVVLGDRRLAKVAYPSRKAMLWDTTDWYHGDRVSYWMMPEARVPNLFVDGHVQVRAAATMNPGFNPTTPTAAVATVVNYQPFAWEPPVLPGQSASVTARQRFTRQGLLGRDVDGAEVNTR